jgi:tRNA pseudouridine65 synthase
MTGPIDVLYRDADVVVVDKPAGIVVHRSDMARERDVAMMRARDAIGAHVWPVHRLDRQTSGALVFALTEDSARALREAWDDGRVQKTYLAIVRGSTPDHVIIDYAIPKSEDGPKVEAVTEVWTLARCEWASLIVASPRTGRYHQVRRHLAHLRHPLANDSNYGTGWFNRKVRQDGGLTRMALHAHTLTLPDVGTITAPLPPDFLAAVGRLGLQPS